MVKYMWRGKKTDYSERAPQTQVPQEDTIPSNLKMLRVSIKIFIHEDGDPSRIEDSEKGFCFKAGKCQRKCHDKDFFHYGFIAQL